MEQWFIKNIPGDYQKIAERFGISDILVKLIINRSIGSEEELSAYLHPSLSRLHSPGLMKDMDKAVAILTDKISKQQNIRIVGDYDVDGVMATYILYTGLNRIGAKVDYDIPERIKDGYGINISIIDKAKEEGIDTILTCDNGIAAMDQIAHAKKLRMTVIVTDHHDIGFVKEDEVRTYLVPKADAVVNPKQEDCSYPYKGICGAVVAYKLVEALYEVHKVPVTELESLLEFAAIATVCDVMDLMDENRVIVKYGLERIVHTTNKGLQALIEETGIGGRSISVYHLGFIIGPCINASGRLESAKLSIQLFLSETVEKAKELARQLKELNDERKEMTELGLNQAIDMIEQGDYEKDKVLVIYLPDCHESLAGIIAGRIKERYHKPSIVLTKVHDGVKGSARSIEAYNMFEELSACKDLLSKFGGHPMAAGLSLPNENVEPLRKRLNEITSLTDKDLMEKVSIDLVLPFPRINYPLIQEISYLEPFGKGNTRPLFAVKNIQVIKAAIIGKNRNVLRMTVAEEGQSSLRFTAMLFQKLDVFEEMVRTKSGQAGLDALYAGNGTVAMDMTFYPDINEYNGIQTIQLIVQNFR